MPTIQTSLANQIDASENKAKIDETAKKLIKHKIILAHILKQCVEEFRDYDIAYIQNHCIIGEPQLNEIAVDQDELDADSMIIGSDTEDASKKEKSIRFDIVFNAKVPKSDEIICLIINLEIQVDPNPGYPLITRVIYYLSRLISRQKGTVFFHSHFEKIRKVYSIWICPDPANKNKNSIAEFGFTLKKTVGDVSFDHKDYDKMTAVIINLNEDGVNDATDIIKLLSTLLSISKNVEERKETLEKEFHIPMTREIEEGMQEMCNLGDAIEYYAEKRGYEKGEKSGYERGEKSGYAAGADWEKRENAKKMKELRLDQGMISQITGLSLSDIAAL